MQRELWEAEELETWTCSGLQQGMSFIKGSSHHVTYSHVTHLVAAIGIRGKFWSTDYTELEWTLGEHTAILVPSEETRPHSSVEWAQSKHKHLKVVREKKTTHMLYHIVSYR